MMKKQSIMKFAAGIFAAALLSLPAMALEDTAVYVCPYGNAACAQNGSCLGDCPNTGVCPNGRLACAQNGACLGDCSNAVCAYGNLACAENGACLGHRTSYSQNGVRTSGGCHGGGHHGGGHHGR